MRRIVDAIDGSPMYRIRFDFGEYTINAEVSTSTYAPHNVITDDIVSSFSRYMRHLAVGIPRKFATLLNSLQGSPLSIWMHMVMTMVVAGYMPPDLIKFSLRIV